MTKRAVGYVRVSDESQVDTFSFDAQRREIRCHCTQHGYQLADVYSDEGFSAHSEKLSDRPALTALLDDAAAGKFDFVVCPTLDRLARNVGVQRQALQRLGAAGVGFRSASEDIDFTTPAGRILLTMLGAASEFFSDQLAVHVAKSF